MVFRLSGNGTLMKQTTANNNTFCARTWPEAVTGQEDESIPRPNFKSGNVWMTCTANLQISSVLGCPCFLFQEVVRSPKQTASFQLCFKALTARVPWARKLVSKIWFSLLKKAENNLDWDAYSVDRGIQATAMASSPSDTLVRADASPGCRTRNFYTLTHAQLSVIFRPQVSEHSPCYNFHCPNLSCRCGTLFYMHQILPLERNAKS